MARLTFNYEARTLGEQISSLSVNHVNLTLVFILVKC